MADVRQHWAAFQIIPFQFNYRPENDATIIGKMDNGKSQKEQYVVWSQP